MESKTVQDRASIVMDANSANPKGYTMPVHTLTQEEFAAEDFDKAESIARKLGYAQFAYTSTSALIGLFCLPENPAYAKPGEATQGGCIIKTRELGFLFVQDGEDRGLGYDWNEV